jgi:hypothetical protein
MRRCLHVFDSSSRGMGNEPEGIFCICLEIEAPVMKLLNLVGGKR